MNTRPFGPSLRAPSRRSDVRPAGLALRTLVVVAALVGLSGCHQAEATAQAAAPPSAAPVAVTTTPVRATQVADRLDLDGTLEARRHARVSPRISGHVAEVKVERGSVVKAGDPLVVLRADDFTLAARAARARVEAQRQQLGGKRGVDQVPEVVAARLDGESARDYLARVEPVHQKGAMDDLAFEQAQRREAVTQAMYTAARQRAQAGFAQLTALSAEADLRASDAEKTVVAAPFAGVVVARHAEVGEFVGPQTPVVELVDASELRLVLDVPERSAAQVRVGQKATITVDGSGAVRTGTVEYLAGALDPSRRTLTIEVVVPNADGEIRPGHFARAGLDLGSAQDAVEVPATALTQRAGVHRIYRVRDGKTEAEIVQIVERRGDDLVIEGALKGGDDVVVAPSGAVADGVRVTSAPADKAGVP